MNYVRGKVVRFEPPKVFQYTFAMGRMIRRHAHYRTDTRDRSHKVTVTHDEWAEDDPLNAPAGRWMATYSFPPEDAA